MTLVQFCGLAILATAAVLLLRETNRSYTAVLVVAFVLVGFLLVIGRTSAAMTVILGEVKDSSLSPYVTTVLKAVGLALLGEMTGDLCRSAGEPHLAGGVEICARAEIVLAGLPLVSEILETAGRLL